MMAVYSLLFISQNAEPKEVHPDCIKRFLQNNISFHKQESSVLRVVLLKL